MSEKKRDVRKLVHEAVEKGANSVEEIHKSIAALPLRILEEAGVMESTAKDLEKIQDRSIGAVYDVIRSVNDEVEKLAGEVLAAGRKAKPKTETKKKTASA